MSPKKILIVDDNKVILETMSLKLTANGYQVITAPDGATGVSVARKEIPDLILLDIGFPVEPSGPQWDGFLVIDWLRRTEETKHIPIIMISRSDPEQSQKRALAAGALALFHKPVDYPQFLETIRQIFERTENQA